MAIDSNLPVLESFICRKFFSINRNRLENNTEHWNALLLSLRELIEWVIRKDTELTGLGPIRGDLSALIKQQVRDKIAFQQFPFQLFPAGNLKHYCFFNTRFRSEPAVSFDTTAARTTKGRLPSLSPTAG